MKPSPNGWPRISAAVYYDDPRAAIAFLCRAFGFDVRLKVEGADGSIAHCELCFGDGVVMVAGTAARPDAEPWHVLFAAPSALGGKNTQSLALFVDDADAHCAQARAAGAVVVREPRTDDHGADYWVDRTYGATDPEGHVWWFMQRMRDPRGPAK
jgi:uncharacterized glyoxalase superfamily protein PhnB